MDCLSTHKEILMVEFCIYTERPLKRSQEKIISSLLHFGCQGFKFSLIERSDKFRIVNGRNGAVAHLARAPRLHRGGKGFDSPQLHQYKRLLRNYLKSFFLSVLVVLCIIYLFYV